MSNRVTKKSKSGPKMNNRFLPVYNQKGVIKQSLRRRASLKKNNASENIGDLTTRVNELENVTETIMTSAVNVSNTTKIILDDLYSKIKMLEQKCDTKPSTSFEDAPVEKIHAVIDDEDFNIFKTVDKPKQKRTSGKVTQIKPSRTKKRSPR